MKPENCTYTGDIVEAKEAFLKKKILIYCQNSFGIGHLAMTLSAVRHLPKDFSVRIIYGGPKTGIKVPKGIEIVQIPVLRDSLTDRRKLSAADDDPSEMDDIRRQRRKKILEDYDVFRPDIVFVEHFPFGRWNYEFEIIPLLDKAKKDMVPVYGLFRGTIGKDITLKKERIFGMIRDHFHKIFVLTSKDHVDLSDEVALPADIEKKLVYCGFAVRKSRDELVSRDKAREALGISGSQKMAIIHGGGRPDSADMIIVGAEFAVGSGYKVLVSAGSHADEEMLKDLKEKGAMVTRFNPDLIDYLAASDLSISAGGYNTTAEILLTGTPSIVMPLGEDEQNRRAAQLAAQDALSVLDIRGIKKADIILHLDAEAKKILSHHKKIDERYLMAGKNILKYLREKHHDYNTFSIVIPTYNRRELLGFVLRCLEGQDYPKDKFEVIVCDDGSSDGTRESVGSFITRSKMDVKYLFQEDKGFRAAKARNMGICAAKNEFVIFLDSDIIVTEDFLSAYDNAITREQTNELTKKQMKKLTRERIGMQSSEHGQDKKQELLRREVAVLGYVAGFNKHEPGLYYMQDVENIMDPKRRKAVRLIPELEREKKYLEARDDMSKIKDPWNIFYSANVAVRRQALLDLGMFDESFEGYGGEDTDLGYRLHKKGITFALCRQALGYHILDRQDWWRDPRRQEKITGENAAQFLENHRRLYEKHKEPSMKAKLERWQKVIDLAEEAEEAVTGLDGRKEKDVAVRCISLERYYSSHPYFAAIIDDEIRAASRENYGKIMFRIGDVFSEGHGKNMLDGFISSAQSLGMQADVSCVTKAGVSQFVPDRIFAEGYVLAEDDYSFSSDAESIVNIIITKENYHYLSDLVSLAHGRGAKKIRLIFPDPVKGKEKLFDSIFPDIYESAAAIKEAVLLADRFGLKRVRSDLSYDYAKPPYLMLDSSDISPCFKVSVGNNGDDEKKDIVVSVVIITNNRKELLEKTLDAIFEQDYAKEMYEVILVDDGSDEDILSMVKGLAPVKESAVNFSYMYWPRDRPFVPGAPDNRTGPSRNLGARYARGEYLIFLDSDNVTGSDFISCHLKSLDNNDVVIGPSYREIEGYDPRDIPLYLCGDKIMEYPWYWMLLYSCNFSVRKKHFEISGGFDKDFVFYGVEDIELGYRFYKMGLKFHFERAVKTTHLYHLPEYINKDLAKHYHDCNARVFYKKFLEPELIDICLDMWKLRTKGQRKKTHMIQIHDRCCNNCSFCPAILAIPSEGVGCWQEKLKTYKDMADKIILSGGEPSLRDDFADIVRAAASGFIVEVETTGIPYSDMGFAENIISSGVKDFLLRIFSDNKEQYARICACERENFQHMMQGFENLKAGGANIGGHLIICSKNAHNASEIVDFFIKKGITSFYITVAFESIRDGPPQKKIDDIRLLFQSYQGIYGRFNKKVKLILPDKYFGCFSFALKEEPAPLVLVSKINAHCQACNLVYLCRANPGKFYDDYLSDICRQKNITTTER